MSAAAGPGRASRCLHRLLIASTLCVLLGPLSHAAGPPPAPGSDRADPVRAELDAVCQRLTTGDNAYFGEAIIETLRTRIAAADAVADDSDARVRLRAWLAGELARLGRGGEAIAMFEATETLARQQLPAEWPLWPELQTSLGLAHLQVAEDENCRADAGADRCILPLAAGGVHRRPQHARAAAERFLALAGKKPDDLQTRWLLDLSLALAGPAAADLAQAVPAAWRLGADAFGTTGGLPRFPNRASALGIDKADHAGGAILDDFDGDGHLDLISSSWHPCEPLQALRADGQGGFLDVAAAWGLEGQLGGLNLVHADYDGDGARDLLVLRGAWLGDQGRIRNSLLRNDLMKSGRFIDVTSESGLAVPAYPTQTAAWADFDGDGDLDVFIGNEAASSSTDPRRIFGLGGRVYPAQLMRNDGADALGRVTFTDVARRTGTTNGRFAKGVAWGDVDNDGDPDLYVSNIGPNRLYRNDRIGSDDSGRTSFVDIAIEAGVVEPSRESFATWFFDADNDGDLDLFVADYSSDVSAVAASYFGQTVAGGHPILYRNDTADGRIRFTDVSADWGLDRPRLPMGANFGDLDNDGWLDVYLGTGVPDARALMPNVMLRNDGGRRFIDVTAAGFGHLQKGHGVAWGDVDRDGDQDIFQQLGGAYPFDRFANALYENPGAPDAAWVTLRLRGTGANTDAIGARIAVTVERAGGDARTIHAVASSGGSFGGSSLAQEIGLGDAVRIRRLEIHWPANSEPLVVNDVAVRSTYEVRESPAALVPVSAPPVPLRPAQTSHRHPGSIR